MKNFWNILSKILRTIVAIPLGSILAIILTPIYLIMFLIVLSIAIIEDIWEVQI